MALALASLGTRFASLGTSLLTKTFTGLRETMDACVGWAGGLGKRGRLVLIGESVRVLK